MLDTIIMASPRQASANVRRCINISPSEGQEQGECQKPLYRAGWDTLSLTRDLRMLRGRNPQFVTTLSPLCTLILSPICQCAKKRRGERWQNCRSPVGNVQVVEVDAVRRLLVVSIELEVQHNSVPARSGVWRIFPVECFGHSVKRERLVQHFVVGSALELNDDVVPGVAGWIARDAGGNPLRVDVIPDSPHLAVHDLALGPKVIAGVVEELSDIELDVFRETEVGAVEVGVVREIVDGFGEGVVFVGQALRGAIAD